MFKGTVNVNSSDSPCNFNVSKKVSCAFLLQENQGEMNEITESNSFKLKQYTILHYQSD